MEQVDNNHKIVWRIGKDQSKEELTRKMRIADPSTFVNKSVYKTYGSFSVGFKIAADYEFLLRIWGKVHTVFIPETMVFMKMSGVSNQNIPQSYRESMAASILHGKNKTCAYGRYYWEVIKHPCIIVPLRLIGCRRM